MPIKHLTVVAALIGALVCGPLHATVTNSPYLDAHSATTDILPLAQFAQFQTRTASPFSFQMLKVADTSVTAAVSAAVAKTDNTEVVIDRVTDLRKSLIGLAMNLRDTRYVYGGRDPSTGFDCSGFVRYVFAHAIGLQLPTNSASQFLAGLKVKRADMKPGDLVFFRTQGKHRVSHVGIYISNGRFIHSPSAGKAVEVASMNSGYWAKRFVGAKRPEAIAQATNNG